MNHFYIPTRSTEDWQRLHPERHWKDGYSAKLLATRWQEAHGFPEEVTNSFTASGIPAFQSMQFVAGFPEHKVALPPSRRQPSQTDIMVLARSGQELAALAVEGKVEESFGEFVRDWRQKDTDGKTERLAFLTDLLGLAGHDLDGIRYQLLHRMASALLTAERFAARHAVVLVHSFSPVRTGFTDYAAFLQLFGVLAAAGTVQQASAVHGIEVYFSWTTGTLI
jgi:hypothetical protein